MALHRPPEKNFLILTAAGKPVYSLYGSEHEVSTIAGVVQAITSFFHDDNDTIRSLRRGDTLIAFLIRSPIILVASSSFGETERQLQEQMIYLHSHIISILTVGQLDRLFKNRINFDLRRVLSGTENTFDLLVSDMCVNPSVTSNAVQFLRMALSTRQKIHKCFKLAASSKPKSILAAMLISGDKLLALTRDDTAPLHPADVRIVQSLARSNLTYGGGESWAPICLPRFNPEAYVHAYMYFLDEAIVLVVLSTNRDGFYEISEWKDVLVDHFDDLTVLEDIQANIALSHYTIGDVSIAGLRHFIFKSKASLQYTAPEMLASEDEQTIFRNYQHAQGQLNHRRIPSMIHQMSTLTETTFGWNSSNFEIYASFGPYVSKASIVASVNTLLRWIQKEEDELFVVEPPVL